MKNIFIEEPEEARFLLVPMRDYDSCHRLYVPGLETYRRMNMIMRAISTIYHFPFLKK